MNFARYGTFNSFIVAVTCHCYAFSEALLHKLIPAGQIRLQQHIRGEGRRSQQVVKQQRHLEVLAGTPLQNLRALCPLGHTAVVQLVELTVGGWKAHAGMGGPIDEGQRKREGGEVIHHIQIGHLLCKIIVRMEGTQEVSNCFGICLCPYLVLLVVAF